MAITEEQLPFRHLPFLGAYSALPFKLTTLHVAFECDIPVPG